MEKIGRAPQAPPERLSEDRMWSVRPATLGIVMVGLVGWSESEDSEREGEVLRRPKAPKASSSWPVAQGSRDHVFSIVE